MEKVAKEIAFYLSTSVEIVASLIIAMALVKFIYAYLAGLLRKDEQLTNSKLRVRFGTSLALALELLLAADILITAVAPSWDDIGKLAAIAAIRTALNYFLERELKEIAKRESATDNDNKDEL